jgi:hypothetical protein
MQNSTQHRTCQMRTTSHSIRKVSQFPTSRDPETFARSIKVSGSLPANLQARLPFPFHVQTSEMSRISAASGICPPTPRRHPNLATTFDVLPTSATSTGKAGSMVDVSYLTPSTTRAGRRCQREIHGQPRSLTLRRSLVQTTVRNFAIRQ